MFEGQILLWYCAHVCGRFLAVLRLGGEETRRRTKPANWLILPDAQTLPDCEGGGHDDSHGDDKDKDLMPESYHSSLGNNLDQTPAPVFYQTWDRSLLGNLSRHCCLVNLMMWQSWYLSRISELYSWRKNCHVEKFQLTMYDNCGEIENFSTSGEISV